MALRVLQGAALVAKQLAQLQAEAGVHRGRVIVPVNWEGTRQGAGQHSANTSPPAPGDLPYGKETPTMASFTQAEGASCSDSSSPAITNNEGQQAQPMSQHRSWRPLQTTTMTAIGGEGSPIAAVPFSAATRSADPVTFAAGEEAGSRGDGSVSSSSSSSSGSSGSRPQRSVPTHAVSRAVHFGGLGVGLAVGAAAAAVRRAVSGGDEGSKGGLLLATDANVDRLASTLCRLRGAALKVGQMLSFNDADVLPPPMRLAMERVRDGADWLPPRQLEETLRSELGDDWRTKLSSFEEQPVAAASIGQVHRAVLEDGRHVAIKVQYPGVCARAKRAPPPPHSQAKPTRRPRRILPTARAARTARRRPISSHLALSPLLSHMVGVADSIQSDLWSMKQLITYTGLVPPGLFLERVSGHPPRACLAPLPHRPRSCKTEVAR
jgi:aarF domain-containing kinase